MEEDYFERFFETSVKCTMARKCGSRRLRTSCTAENIQDVNDLIMNQEGAPQTYLTSIQIARKTGIHGSSVVRIIWDDLREITSHVCEETTRAGAVQSKLYQPFAIKLT